MQTLIMAGQLILSLAILVTLHELGHYLAARMFGIKVEKFYLFFDAWKIKLLSFRKGDTEYGIGWLPLGGYVKIAGMIDESMDKEQLQKPAQPWEFRSKPAWQRLIVMIGGVTVNLLLGMFIFWMVTWSLGDVFLPASQMKYGIVPQPAAAGIGLDTGDFVRYINDKPVEKFEDITNPRIFLKDNIVLKVERNGQMIDIPVPGNMLDRMVDNPKTGFVDYRCTFFVDSIINEEAIQAGLKKGDRFISINGNDVKFFDVFQATLREYKNRQVKAVVLRGTDTVNLTLKTDTAGTIGFFHDRDVVRDTIKYSFGESFSKGINRSIESLTLNVIGFKKVLTGQANARKSLAGPIGIAKQFGPTWDWARFWVLTGLISLILAFMNILPIPALDGGHVLILLIEMIAGRPLPERVQVILQTVGMIILLLLMVFIFGNDILKLFGI